MHTPPGARRPELTIGDAGFGLSAAGRRACRSAAACRRASRRPTADPPSRWPRAAHSRPSVASAPPLSRLPRGMPGEHRLRLLAGARRSTRLSVGRGGVGVDQPVFGISGGEHQAGQAATPARVDRHGRHQHRIRPALHPQHPPGGPLGDERGRASRAAPPPPRSARDRWPPPAGPGRCSPPARPWRTGRRPAGSPAVRRTDRARGRAGARPARPPPRPSPASREVRRRGTWRSRPARGRAPPPRPRATPVRSSAPR